MGRAWARAEAVRSLWISSMRRIHGPCASLAIVAKKRWMYKILLAKQMPVVVPTTGRRQLTSRPWADKSQARVTIVTGRFAGNQQLIHKVFHSR